MPNDERPADEDRTPLAEPAGWSRRDFVRRLSAAIALAGLDACTRAPREHILPYVEQAPEMTPGRASWYATSTVLDGLATGVLVESRDGRPIKVEGNPDHPASLGASGMLQQAAVWQLYDPDRARHPTHRGTQKSRSEASLAMKALTANNTIGARGEGLRMLLEPTGSPTDCALIDAIHTRFPAAGIHFHAPFATRALGSRVLTLPDFTAPRVIVAIESDFLAGGPFHLRHAHDYAESRAKDMGRRLYVAESGVSVTGATADHRFALDPRDAHALLANACRLAAGNATSGDVPAWLPHIVDDLRRTPASSLIVVGDCCPPDMHALTATLNDALGNTGHTVHYTPSPLYGAGNPSHSLEALLSAIDARGVATLISIGGNPCYTTPASAQYRDRMRTVAHTMHAGMYTGETGQNAEWFVPLAHDFERWGDARAFDGTASIVQPLISPMHESMSVTEILMILAGITGSSYDRVRSTWRGLGAGADSHWDTVLQRGVLAGSAFTRASAPSLPALRASDAPAQRANVANAMAVMLIPDAGVYDGAFANVPWMQELPRPITTLTWGNAAHVSPRTAARLGVADGMPLRVLKDSRNIVIPALIVPGHADDCLTIAAGFGRTGTESVAAGVGMNVFPLQERTGEFVIDGVAVTRAEAPRVDLARTQLQMTMAGRDLMPVVTPSHPAVDRSRRERRPSVYEGDNVPVLDAPHQWAMTIDLDRCIGCGACVVGCQAENNVPVVGPQQIRRGRSMNWLRIDTYHTEAAGLPPVLVQPMLCQHCEKAPCEYVCPVEATVHSPDGLNEMVYNRCVGTRFCSNNCPYKVRRFNWFDFADDTPELLQLARNPDVTVRDRGVMEKCSFCVQRIREAEITASVEKRPLAGTEVHTACQQACPTGAIVFGSLTDEASRRALDRDNDRAFDSLDELGTRPRVRYLARRRNPNPALDGVA